MSPRLCVEMDLAMMLPDEVVIAIGTEKIFHQKIEYDMRIGFCFHCHLQGHLESNCRKKQSQATPRPADPSSSTPPGNASLLTPNGDVVSAALPAGSLRAHARDLKRNPSSVLPSPSDCTPPACENAPSTNFPHYLAPDQAPSCPSLPLATPSNGLTQSPTQSSPLAIPSDDINPQTAHLPSNSSAPPQSAPPVQTLVVHNQFALLMDDNVLPSEPVLGVPSISPMPNAPANPQPLALPTIPTEPNIQYPLPISAASASLPCVSPHPILHPDSINRVPLNPPVLKVMDNAHSVLACSRAAQAFLDSPSLLTLRTLPCPLDRPPHIPTSLPDSPILAICDTPPASQQTCTLNAADSLSPSFYRALQIFESPITISSAPKRVPDSIPAKKTKLRGRPKGSLNATKKGAPPPSSS
ncbi:hypothetical protein CFOL_v3_07557 [Cephalotus follicularis]|uniref:Zf-CCHC_4 domain-containing protein n=1 Tax=Cephalotus follicularis TaxID=3775 RepID=A0A1Q3B7Y6_CEPFO|nr:hypothetical protein CFOL_v3_07557 [Cephalotus follicularis]